MSIRVEFYGIPRQRAGVEVTEVEAATLSEVFRQLREKLPAFAEACLNEEGLQPTYMANINGESFTSDPEMPLHSGDTVMILSADAGG